VKALTVASGLAALMTCVMIVAVGTKKPTEQEVVTAKPTVNASLIFPSGACESTGASSCASSAPAEGRFLLVGTASAQPSQPAYARSVGSLSHIEILQALDHARNCVVPDEQCRVLETHVSTLVSELQRRSSQGDLDARTVIALTILRDSLTPYQPTYVAVAQINPRLSEISDDARVEFALQELDAIAALGNATAAVELQKIRLVSDESD
jgi:hypothetical protein